MTALQQVNAIGKYATKPSGFLKLISIIDINPTQPLYIMIGLKYRIIFKSDRATLVRFLDHLVSSYGWVRFNSGGGGNPLKTEFAYDESTKSVTDWHVRDTIRELWVTDKSVYDDFLVTEKLKGNLL